MHQRKGFSEKIRDEEFCASGCVVNAQKSIRERLSGETTSEEHQGERIASDLLSLTCEVNGIIRSLPRTSSERENSRFGFVHQL